MNDLLIGEPCPNCGSKSTYVIFDTDVCMYIWSCETCFTVWADIAPDGPVDNTQVIAMADYSDQLLPDDYDPDFPYLLIIDGSEPLPDPSWDYAQIYYRAMSIRREVEALFKSLEVDDGTPETDQAIRDRLRQMSAQINAATGELD